jgi:hypothetical protein
VSNATEDLGTILLDGLAGAAAIPTLAAGEIDGQVIRGERKPGRDPLDGDAKRRPVRFTGREEAERAHLVVVRA